MKIFGFLSVIILIGMATTMSFAAIDPSTIVGLWHFDEGNGSTVADSSGNGHDGEIDGAGWV